MTAPFQLRGQRAANINAQARGDDAEDLVENLHAAPAFRAAYPHTLLARRYTKRILVAGKLRDIRPQGPDFSGGLRIARCSVPVWCEVEVKAVDPAACPRLAFERFSDREVEVLTACRAAGGVAVVLVLHGPSLVLARWCPMPWGMFEGPIAARAAELAARPPKRKGERAAPTRVPASMSEEEILRHAVRWPHEYLRSAWVGPGK